MAVYSPIQVGDKQPNPFLGLDRYAPVVGDIGGIPSDWSFGNSSNYVSPFTSWSQQIVNANNYLGPYARRVSDGKSGRIIVSTISPSLGEIGFVEQCWYGFDDTPYNTVDGTANGIRYQSKTDWWKSTTKTIVCLKDLMVEGHPSVAIEVAISSNNIGWISGGNAKSAVDRLSSGSNYGSCGTNEITGLPEGIFGDDAGVADDGVPSGADGLGDGPLGDITDALENMWNNVSNASGAGIVADAFQNAVTLYLTAFYYPHYKIGYGNSSFETGKGFGNNSPIIWRPSEMSQKRWLKNLSFNANNCDLNLPSSTPFMSNGYIDPSWFLTIYNRAFPDLKLSIVGDEISMKESYGFTPSPNTQPLGDVLEYLIGKSASDSIRVFLDFSPLNLLMGSNLPFINSIDLNNLGAAIKVKQGLVPNTLVGGNLDAFKPTTLDIRFSLKNIPQEECANYLQLCNIDLCNLGPQDTKISICG